MYQVVEFGLYVMTDFEDENYELSTISSVSTKPYMFEPTRTLTPSSNQPNEAFLPEQDQENTCSCGKCSITGISSSFSSVCCQKSHRILSKMHAEDSNCKCIAETSAFKVVCLNEDILRVSFRRIVTIRKKRRKSSREVFNDSARRWTAYSQFIFWIYDGILGESIRKVLPNCVYNAIRQTFPSLNCEYSDFRPGDNDDILID